MNKLVKASVATGAGIALLMGGAGSLALWNDSATVTSGTVSTGELSLTSNADGAWDTGITRWVPGDSDTYTETFVIKATGDNIEAEISAAYSGATVNGVTSSSTISVAGETESAPGIYTLDAGTYTVTVTVDVSFDATGTANQNIAAQPLGDVSVTLQQI
jgi:alternate signal-mediated exported protein